MLMMHNLYYKNTQTFMWKWRSASHEHRCHLDTCITCDLYSLNHLIHRFDWCLMPCRRIFHSYEISHFIMGAGTKTYNRLHAAYEGKCMNAWMLELCTYAPFVKMHLLNIIHKLLVPYRKHDIGLLEWSNSYRYLYFNMYSPT